MAVDADLVGGLDQRQQSVIIKAICVETPACAVGKPNDLAGRGVRGFGGQIDPEAAHQFPTGLGSSRILTV